MLTESYLKSIGKKNFASILKKKRNCSVYGCKETAIKSHIIWKGGVISKLAVKGHVLQLSSGIDRYRLDPLHIATVGINEALTFKGFCNFHDTKIFFPIEEGKRSLKTKRNQILLVLRALFFERTKKQVIIDWYEAQLAEKILPLQMQEVFLRAAIGENQLGIQYINWYIDELNIEFNRGKERFQFNYFEFDEIELTVNGIFHIEDIYKNIPNYVSHNSLLVCVMPFMGKSVLVVGFHNNFLENFKIISRIRTFTQKDFKNFALHLITYRLENWVCSQRFFDQYIKHGLEAYLRLFQETHNEPFSPSMMTESPLKIK